MRKIPLLKTNRNLRTKVSTFNSNFEDMYDIVDVFIIVLEFFISLTFSNGSKNDVQILTTNTINYLQQVTVNISIL